MSSLDTRELGILIEAMELWERNDGDIAGKATAEMMQLVANCDSAEEAMLQAVKHQPRLQKQFDDSKSIRKECAVLLRAKLIGIRDATAVDELARDE